jgi:hypothetical protein
MPDLDGLIDLIPIDDIAKKLGVDPSVAESAVKTALPAIVGGLAANAQDKGGAQSLEKALQKHAGSSGKINVNSIDTADGEKIVSHVFGSKKNEVVAAVAKKSDNATQEIIAQILPIVAPIVLSWLATQFLSPKKEAAPKAEPKASSGGGIGEILGGLLGSSQGQEIIGGVLGGLLGGGTKN